MPDSLQRHSSGDDIPSVYLDGAADDLDLGFATFYLNRTNRSGILDARPIGGLEQTGKWRINARFDREKLSARMRVLSRYASRVVIREEDGIGLVERCLADGDSFIYADPPYLAQGRRRRSAALRDGR